MIQHTILPRNFTLEDIIAWYKGITGREPTQEEIQEALKEVESGNVQEGLASGIPLQEAHWQWKGEEGRWFAESETPPATPTLPGKKPSKYNSPGPLTKNPDELKRNLASPENVKDASHMGEGGHVNSTYMMKMKSPGLKGIFKPISGEAVGDGDNSTGQSPSEKANYRNTIPMGTRHHREVAAYNVAKATGTEDMVPVTTYMNHPGLGEGSIQEFRSGIPAGMHPDSEAFAHYGDQHQRAAAFDYLIGHTDRHPHNWMVGDQGNLVLIDNGDSLPERDEPFGTSDLYQRAARKRLSIPDNVKDWKWPEIEKAMGGNISDDAKQMAKSRFHELKHAKTFDELPELGMKTYRGDHI